MVTNMVAIPPTASGIAIEVIEVIEVSIAGTATITIVIATTSISAIATELTLRIIHLARATSMGASGKAGAPLKGRFEVCLHASVAPERRKAARRSRQYSGSHSIPHRSGRTEARLAGVLPLCFSSSAAEAERGRRPEEDWNCPELRGRMRWRGDGAWIARHLIPCRRGAGWNPASC